MLEHIENMIKEGKVLDESQVAISDDHYSYVEFINSDEVKCVKEDKELVNYFYKNAEDLSKTADGWTVCYNKNGKLVRYK